ncbi:MAG: amidohydrolase [Candidatus Latescibacterota bacterium]
MRSLILPLIAMLGFTSAFSPAFAAGFSRNQINDAKQTAVRWVDGNRKAFEDAAIAIHGFAEIGLEEYQSSKALADLMEKNGFQVERGVADMPTAFVATFGSGKPIIGILAEYDALPGLSQKASQPVQQPVVSGAPGHGCGHNLLGAGSCAAAVAMKAAMEKHTLSGTVRLYGCPAEETIIGKVYMAKAGLFNDLDACLVWHPSGENKVHVESNRALNSFEVTFHGKTAHAAGDPWSGRSALDAVELMSVGVNYLREHSRESVRIHSIIQDGGKAPNIVPDYSRVWYFVRDSTRKGVEETYDRVLKCAEGAALMTGTTMKVNLITGVYNYLPNRVISEVLQQNLTAIGAPGFQPQEVQFARALQKSLGAEEKGPKTQIEPLGDGKGLSGGSTDASDVSWIVPTSGEMGVVCNPEGTPGHHWGVTASSGSTLGLKGMATAGKVLAASGVELLMTPGILEKARAEFKEKTKDSPYKSPIPDGQKPPIPERKN